MTIAQLPPFDLRTVYPWMQPDAVFAAHFKQGQYWLDDAKGPIAASSLLATTRSSGINLPNAAGVYQALGNNTLPRTDRGLYANGQIAAINENGNNPQSATGWATNGATVTNAPDEGFFKPVYVASSGPSGMNDRRGTAAGLTFDGSATVAAKIRWDQGLSDSGAVNAISAASGNTLVRGTRGAVTIDSIAGGPVTIVSQSTRHMDLLWTPNATASGNVRVGPYTTIMGGDIKLLGIDITNTPFIPDAWVSTSSPATPLLASDIRAVQGVRPSNSQPEPFPGWEAAGLDDAVAGKAVVNIDRLNASAARFIAGAGVDADNLWRLIFDTDNRFKLIVRKNGVDEVTLQTGAVAATGDKTVTWQAKPGDYAIAATGVAEDTDSDGATLPAGATTLRVGSDFGVLNPFNGWIEQIQIARAA